MREYRTVLTARDACQAASTAFTNAYVEIDAVDHLLGLAEMDDQ